MSTCTLRSPRTHRIDRDYIASREYLYLVYKWMRGHDDIGHRGRRRRPAHVVLKLARVYVAAILA